MIEQLTLLAEFCVVCGDPGTVTTIPLNGLPLGVVCCDDCRQAVKRREVGISRINGVLSVTDGRKKDKADAA